MRLSSKIRQKSIPTEPPARKQKPLSAQQAIGAFWRTDHTFSASIRITNNLSVAPLAVTPVLYMADGTEYSLAPVQVPPLSVATVSVNDALAAAPPQILSHLSNYGSATLQYTWRWGDAVSGSVVSLDAPRSLTFTSRFVAPSPASEAVQDQIAEGLWWIPFPQSSGFVAVRNTTSAVIKAAIQSFGPAGESLETTTQSLEPQSTRWLALQDFINTGLGKKRVGGIRVSYHGQRQSLIVSGGIEDALKGYSAAIPFAVSMASMNMETTGSSAAAKLSIASAGIMVGKQDSMMGFPQKTTFNPMPTFGTSAVRRLTSN